jgi:hypothetical protein
MRVDGQCHCGKIAYEAEVDPATAAICHCTDCQNFSGSPYRASVAAKVGDFRVLHGTPKLYVKTAQSRAERSARRRSAAIADRPSIPPLRKIRRCSI